ncbi:hypothetical protein VTN02DRAFT_1524 [Thermoascus thermophilus]
MTSQSPRYYENTLEPVRTDREGLSTTLKELQSAVRHGVDLLQKGCPPAEPAEYGSMYSGAAGVALTFLRLERQAGSLSSKNAAPLQDFRKLARERILPEGPEAYFHPGRLSPLESPYLAAITLRLTAACSLADETKGDSGQSISAQDIADLGEAVQLALQHGHIVVHRGRNIGGDEVLYGRAGLLWAILNLRQHVFDEKTAEALEPTFRAVPELVDAIINAGKKTTQAFAEVAGPEQALPLMWMWMEQHYLGATHGVAGNLTTLLQCRVEELDDGASRKHMPLIADTITSLCRVCIANNGHLPLSMPPRSSARGSPLVQVCHGAPGILLLLATARKNAYLTSRFWQPEWDQATQLAAERVWEEGLLSKGGSLCHGLAGNAWTFLLLHDCFEYDVEDMKQAKRLFTQSKTGAPDGTKHELTGDYFLSRALALLLEARETRPYSSGTRKTARDYRMPDDPYSLFEGLAGNVCAWAEACAVIEARLRKMELEDEGKVNAFTRDQIFREHTERELGFPGLGGHGPRGLI